MVHVVFRSPICVDAEVSFHLHLVALGKKTLVTIKTVHVRPECWIERHMHLVMTEWYLNENSQHCF